MRVGTGLASHHSWFIVKMNTREDAFLEFCPSDYNSLHPAGSPDPLDKILTHSSMCMRVMMSAVAANCCCLKVFFSDLGEHVTSLCTNPMHSKMGFNQWQSADVAIPAVGEYHILRWVEGLRWGGKSDSEGTSSHQSHVSGRTVQTV